MAGHVSKVWATINRRAVMAGALSLCSCGRIQASGGELPGCIFFESPTNNKIEVRADTLAGVQGLEFTQDYENARLLSLPSYRECSR